MRVIYLLEISSFFTLSPPLEGGQKNLEKRIDGLDKVPYRQTLTARSGIVKACLDRVSILLRESICA